MGQNGAEYAIALKFYRIIFNPPVYSDGGNSGFCLELDSMPNEYHNCVFVPPVGGWNRVVKDASASLYNCLLLGGANSSHTSDPITGIAENCASNSNIMEPTNGTKTTCLTNIKVDENYNIISEGWKNTGTGLNPDGTQANIGIYGGKYAWK